MNEKVENYTYAKQIFNIGIPSLIILIAILSATLYLATLYLNSHLIDRYIHSTTLFSSVHGIYIFIVSCLFLPNDVLLLNDGRIYYNKGYGFYIAKTCMNIIATDVNKNEVEKVNYLILAIQSYNAYL